MKFLPIAAVMLAALEAPVAAANVDPAIVTAIETACYDYLDGQLEGDVDRVARSLHPDLAKRSALPSNPDETFALRRMTKDELVGLTRKGVLKTPLEQWQRSVQILDVTGNAASARVETPWFVDYFHLARWSEKWLIVNALWHPKR